MGGDRDRDRDRPGGDSPALDATVPAAGTTRSDDGSPPRVPADHLGRGDALGRYTILAQVGEGGMGTVYAAYDPDLDRKVALKLLRVHPHSGAIEQARARLLREARAMARLAHPNVITVFEVGSVGERDFVAMEFVAGRSLDRELEARRRPWPRTLELYLRAGRGLAAAHTAGLIHRDFKPGNVLVGEDGRVRVTDFGLARALNDAEAAPAPAAAAAGGDLALTRTGALMGTPAYMAPEQHAGGAVDTRTDQFSFCVALYEGLYGVRPFSGGSLAALAAAVQAGAPAARPEGSGVPARVHRVLLRGLRPEPAERYPSMNALLAELARAGRPPGRRWLAAALALAVAAAGLALLLMRSGDRQPERCGGFASGLDGVWDDAVQERLRAAFSATGSPTAEAAWAGFARALDGYAAGWIAMQTNSCEATYVRREQSEELHLLRMACLVQRRGELLALTVVFAEVDAAGVERAVPAAHGLISIVGCADADLLRSQVAPPDRAIARKVDTARALLDGVKALQESGSYVNALEQAGKQVAAARQIDYAPLTAEALYRLGEVQRETGDSGAARRSLEEAVLFAEESGHLEIQARALVSLTAVVAEFSSEYELARQLARRAQAAVKRFGHAPALAGAISESLAQVAVAEESYDDAIGRYRETLALYEQALAPDDVRLAGTLAGLADVLERRRAFAEALPHRQRAVAILVQSLGDHHPRVAEARERLAGLLRQSGRYDEARAEYERARRFWATRRGGEVLGLALRGAELPAGHRVLRGHVLGPDGAPAAGAEVMAATELISDGKYLCSGLGGARDRGIGLVVGRTDGDGRFELAGVADQEVLAAAESEAGRSLPAVVAAGPAEVELELRLLPYGSLRGTVAGIDPRTTVFVLAIPKSLYGRHSKDVGTGVVAGVDGAYEFPRLPAAEYRLLVAREGGGRLSIHAGPTVAVAAGAAARADVRDGGAPAAVGLEIEVVGERGAEIPVAQVVLLDGGVGARTITIRALQGQFLRTLARGRLRTAFTQRGKPVTMSGLTPGRHTICVLPLGGDLRDPDYVRRLGRHLEDLVVYCRPIAVAGSPGVQRHTVAVPPPTPLVDATPVPATP